MVYSRIRFKIVQNPFFRKRIYLKSMGSHPPGRGAGPRPLPRGFLALPPGAPPLRGRTCLSLPTPHPSPRADGRPASAASPRSRLFKKLTSLLCLGGAPLAGCHGSLWLTGKSSVM